MLAFESQFAKVRQLWYTYKNTIMQLILVVS